MIVELNAEEVTRALGRLVMDKYRIGRNCNVSLRGIKWSDGAAVKGNSVHVDPEKLRVTVEIVPL